MKEEEVLEGICGLRLRQTMGSRKKIEVSLVYGKNGGRRQSDLGK